MGFDGGAVRVRRGGECVRVLCLRMLCAVSAGVCVCVHVAEVRRN